ncbi:MAG: hypothetical protein R2724_06955 [Bryobacterales bacterium]
MRTQEADGEEEGAVLLLSQTLAGPRGGAEVGHLVVTLGERTPVGAGFRPIPLEVLFRAGSETGRASAGLFQHTGRRVLVEELADTHGLIAVFAEVFEQEGNIAHGVGSRAQLVVVDLAVDAGRRRVKSGHDASARGSADGRLAVRVGEQRAARSEPVDVRRAGVGVPVHAADPVVEIVDGDHQDIGVIGGEERRGGENEGEQEAGAHG